MADLIDKIALNENAYFYRQEKYLSVDKIRKIFRDAINDKAGKRKLQEVKKKVSVGSKIVPYSLLVIEYSTDPTFLLESIPTWKEIKFGYLLIVEYPGYIVVLKKNVSGISKLNSHISHVDYDRICNAFVETTSKFERMGLSNMDISDNAIRKKSIEALNLKGAISPFEANKKIINFLRVDSAGKKLSLGLNTSRVNTLQDRKKIEDIVKWIGDTCVQLNAASRRDSFLNNFARPISFEANASKLNPISILLRVDILKELKEQDSIDHFKRETDDGKYVDIDVIKELQVFDTIKEIKVEGSLPNGQWQIENDFDEKAKLVLNQKSFSIRSEELSKIYIEKDGDRQSVVDFINSRQLFLVNFEEADIIYTARKLFQDHQLLESMDDLIEVFEPHPALTKATSEKGGISKSKSKFDSKSLFGIIEKELASEFDFLLCDDLGNEWADFIGISSNSVTFLHAKYKDGVGLSGSNLHEVVSQVQKNLGSLEPTKEMLQAKGRSWTQKYSGSKINKLRKGVGVDKFVETFESVPTKPNYKKKVVLVVNYISKSELEKAFRDLKAGKSFARKKEVLQILWLVSSLVSNCIELRTDVMIYCVP